MSTLLDIKLVTYHVRDMKDEEILDVFYEHELQKVKKSTELYQDEMILKS